LREKKIKTLQNEEIVEDSLKKNKNSMNVQKEEQI
jgi:hypothetical protein